MPEWIGEPPFASEWNEEMRSLLGKRVKVVIDRDKPVVVTGMLLSFNEGGEVAIREEDGFVTWAWPALEASELSVSDECLDHAAEHYTDESRYEIEYGINVGNPVECCDPVLITDDPGTASENEQIIRDPYPMRRTVTTTFGPWELVDLDAL